MDRNIRIAKELVRLAKSLVAASKFSGEFNYNKSRNEVTITLYDPDKVNDFVRSPDYKTMESWFLNAEGGARDYTKKSGKAMAQFSLAVDDENSKSHAAEIKDTLKGLGLEEK